MLLHVTEENKPNVARMDGCACIIRFATESPINFAGLLPPGQILGVYQGCAPSININ